MSKIHEALKKAEREKITEQIAVQQHLLEVKQHRPKLLTKKKETQREETVSQVKKESKYSVKSLKEPSLDQHLVTLLDPKSFAAEQFRKLKTSILEYSKGNFPRCILVTSSVLDEGKTMTAANLAISIAQGIQKHTLLIDADLRKPDLHNYFGLNPGSGLSDYLTHDIQISDLLIKTSIPRLTLLPAGPVSDEPTELLSSNKMQNLIEEVRSRYKDRYIVIDSSPIMFTSEPDILCRQVDGVIFMVRAGNTPREIIQRSLRSLDKEKILGIVFNDVELRIAGYRYGYYNYYSYGKKK